MDAEITVTVEKETQELGYVVEMTISAATNIVQELFILKKEDLAFDRVASTYDLVHIPNEQSPGYPIFRAVQFQRVFPLTSKQFALNFIDITVSSLQRLVDSVNLVEFDGSETHTIPPP